MNAIWAKRDKQIERVIKNVSGMYGDMQGIIGASLPEIRSLELKALIAEGDSEEGAEGRKDDLPRKNSLNEVSPDS